MAKKKGSLGPDNRVTLAKGIVSLVEESQRALEVNFDPQLQAQSQSDEVELHSGLLDKIQLLVSQRETLVNTAVNNSHFLVFFCVISSCSTLFSLQIFAQDLEGRIRAFEVTSEQMSQLKSKIDLDGYIGGLKNLQNLSAQVFEG